MKYFASFRINLAAAVVASLTHATCANTPTNPSPIALGAWGGDHVAMTVQSVSAHFEFDCAHGDVATALVANTRSEFSATGVFVREHGGPVREAEVPDSHPASYEGTVKARRIILTLRLTDTGETAGPFTLDYGVAGRIVKCL
jgi:hypothetical protein